jgi:hypothetical protein
VAVGEAFDERGNLKTPPSGACRPERHSMAALWLGNGGQRLPSPSAPTCRQIAGVSLTRSGAPVGGRRHYSRRVCVLAGSRPHADPVLGLVSEL